MDGRMAPLSAMRHAPHCRPCAMHHMYGVQVAVKRFRPEVLRDDVCLRLICNEIDIMVKLKHR